MDRDSAINFSYSIIINKSRDIVWDFTQNYDNRSLWDSTVVETKVIQTLPNRIVELKLNGGTRMTFVYKLDDRPRKTSLVAKEISSPMIINAGGSWVYEDLAGKTRWTQTNTLVFKENGFIKLMRPVLRAYFKWVTIQTMRKAKRLIEKLP